MTCILHYFNYTTTKFVQTTFQNFRLFTKSTLNNMINLIALDDKLQQIRRGRFGVRFPGKLNQTQCRQRLATPATFLRNCVVQALSGGGGPATGYSLRRDPASTMKILIMTCVFQKRSILYPNKVLVGFDCFNVLKSCKFGCPSLRIVRVTISCLFQRFVLIFKGNVLQNVNVRIS